MKLSRNSISAKLYRWFYATSNLPESLCPYFWKLILMWVFILPYTAISVPSILMDLKEPSDKTTGERAGVGVIMWFIIFMLVCMLSWAGLIFDEPVNNSLWFHMLAAGFIGWGVTIIFSVAGLFKWTKEKLENRHIKYDEDGYRIWDPVKEKQPSIIKEFVKAKYHKYCPKIDWK